jgi:nickel-dependent lactate racemase
MRGPISFPYGRNSLEWQPDADLDVTVVAKPEPPPLSTPEAAILAALAGPIGSPGLEELARGARSATIVVTDATRPCPDHLLVPPLLAALEGAGVPADSISILVAIGMHRPSTREEKIEKLGADIVSRYRVIDSAPTDPTRLVALGTAPGGDPILIDRYAVETDLLVATGVVEPHQYAGFSGGWKTVAIGVAGASTITALHGMRDLEDPGVRLAVTEENPFLETARWAGERARLRFVVNVALDSDARIVRVAAGHPERVHAELSRWVGERAVVPIGAPFPIVIGAAGHPKDSNLYQATRVPTYLCFGKHPVVTEGGVLIVPAACPEGAGQGAGERLFQEMLEQGGSPADIVERARHEGYPAGGQRAVMVAWALQQAAIAFVGTADPELPRRLGMESFPTIEAAVSWARGRTGSRRVLAVPRALTTLPEAMSGPPESEASGC